MKNDAPLFKEYSKCKNPRVSIVILNWNGWKDTIECLESLYRIDYPNYDVIIVDNGSTDDSIRKIKEYCLGKIKVDSKLLEYKVDNKPIEVFEISEDEAEKGSFNLWLYEKYENNRRMILIKAENNYGYAGGNNLGITFALRILEPEWVLILNNDVVVDRTCLSQLVKAATETRAGIAGPKNYLYTDPNALWLAWFDVDMRRGKPILLGAKKIDRGEYGQIRYVPFVAGSCLLIKSQVIEEIGLFDEEYFCYWDETDYCARVRRARYNILYVPSAKVWHKVSSTAKRRAEYYITRNRFLFMKKHASNKDLDSFLLWFLLVDFWLKIIYILIRQSGGTLKYCFRGVKDGIVLLLASRESKIIWFLKELFIFQQYFLQRLNFNKTMELKIVLKLLNPERGERILDIGCGGGVFSRKLVERGCKVYGIDISASAINVAKMMTDGESNLIVGEAESLPYQSEAFDKIACICALEHFRDDEKALAEMCRVLKSDGALVLSVDSFTYGVESHIKEKHKKDHKVVNYYSFPQLKKKLEKTGLMVIDYKYFINSPLSALFFKFGIRNRFGYLYKAIFPVAYILSIVSDRFLGSRDKGFILAVKAKKKDESTC